MISKIISLLKTKFAKNAIWIIGGKVFQMALSFFISIITARYLGPSNYGIINYVDSFIVFFTPLCTLGIENVIVKELVHKPDEQGKTLGSSMVLQVASSLCSIGGIVLIVGFMNKWDKTYLLIALLYSLGLFFKCFEIVQYWYQSKLMSKVSSTAGIIAYTCMSVYRVFLLATQKSIEWFAFSTTVDAIVLSALLFFCYKRDHGPEFRFSWSRGRQILKSSYHFIISGMMVAVYWQFDKIMLKHMIDEASVGYYATATKLCTIWAFFLVAIIDSVRPHLFEIYKTDEKKFEKETVFLYSAIIYISFAVSILFCIFAPIVVKFMYGEEYMQSVPILRVVTWSTAFSYLGTSRSIWILSKGLEKYEKYMAIVGIVCNVVLNLLLIPLCGAVGAAIATLITQVFVNYIIMFLIKDLKPNGKMITDAFLIFRQIKKTNKKS